VQGALPQGSGWDREEQETDAKNYKRFGWQYELGKKLQRPREKELRKLA